MKKKHIIMNVVLVAAGIVIGAVGGFMFAMHMFHETWGFTQRGQLVELEEVALDAYRSSDPEHAERALLRVATNLQDLIEMDLGTEIPNDTDLHFSLVVTYGRLGHLLESQGKTHPAQSYYDLALENWNSMDHGEAARPLPLDKLKTLITTMDKTEEDSQPEN